MEKSLFAQALQALFDETGLHSRTEWSEYLRLESPKVIELWCTDKAVPRADHIFMVLDTLREASGIPEGPLESFEAMMRRPAMETTSISSFIGKTVEEYMNSPIDVFTQRLRNSCLEDRIRLLEGTYYPPRES